MAARLFASENCLDQGAVHAPRESKTAVFCHQPEWGLPRWTKRDMELSRGHVGCVFFSKATLGPTRRLTRQAGRET